MQLAFITLPLTREHHNQNPKQKIPLEKTTVYIKGQEILK
jgi:hypothetical protein